MKRIQTLCPYFHSIVTASTTALHIVDTIAERFVMEWTTPDKASGWDTWGAWIAKEIAVGEYAKKEETLLRYQEGISQTESFYRGTTHATCLPHVRPVDPLGRGDTMVAKRLHTCFANRVSIG